MELVIARYNEDIDWINLISSDVSIKLYNKGDDISHENIKLANIGRESHTYLTYLVENYDRIPDDGVIFTQGRPFDHVPDFLTKLKIYEKYTPFSTFGYEMVGASHPPHMNFEVMSPKNIFENILMKKNTNQKYTMLVFAIFYTTKSSILRHTKEVYEKLLNLHVEIGDSMAYTMEYSWHLLFEDIYYE
jgi:hypothetical protein